jgi:lysophospholipase L1-like esterase
MDRRNNGRRKFLKQASAAGALSLGLSQIVSSAFGATKPPKIVLKQNDVVVLQGDSITDAGRNREELSANKTGALGTGYALLAGSKLLRNHAAKNLQVYNRGISGNKVYQLAERWDADCLELKPSVLSILIGVNDFWHTLTGRYDGTIDTYRNDLKALLQRTKEKLPDVKLIIGEPFAVAGVKSVDDKWFPRFFEYQKSAREIASEFGAVFIPYQSVFDKAAKVAPPAYWTGDGVHTTLAGSELMAEAWLAALS